MIQADGPNLVLASQSKSRGELLRGARVEFSAQPAHIDEAGVKQSARADGVGVGDVAVLLAELKAARISARNPDALVIGADQILVCDGVWFDKPDSMEQAREHLRFLRGKTHRLVTSVVCMRDGNRLWHHIAEPRLTMRAFSDAFLAEYLAEEGDAAMETVGAYRLEGLGVHLFDRIEGEFSAILGLPLLPLLGFLRQHGVMMG